MAQHVNRREFSMAAGAISAAYSLAPGAVMGANDQLRLGFIGVCDTATDWNLPACEDWMARNAANAERLLMTTRRFYRGHPGPSRVWKIYIVPPAK